MGCERKALNARKGEHGKSNPAPPLTFGIALEFWINAFFCVGVFPCFPFVPWTKILMSCATSAGGSAIIKRRSKRLSTEVAERHGKNANSEPDGFAFGIEFFRVNLCVRWFKSVPQISVGNRGTQGAVRTTNHSRVAEGPISSTASALFKPCMQISRTRLAQILSVKGMHRESAESRLQELQAEALQMGIERHAFRGSVGPLTPTSQVTHRAKQHEAIQIAKDFRG